MGVCLSHGPRCRNPVEYRRSPRLAQQCRWGDHCGRTCGRTYRGSVFRSDGPDLRSCTSVTEIAEAIVAGDSRSRVAYSSRPPSWGMEPTTTGRFRVLDRRPDGRLLLVDLDEAVAAVADDDPEADLQPLAAVPPEADDKLAETVRSLKPGYGVTASLSWDDSEAQFVDCAVDDRTWIQYADGVSGLFEVAQETWYDAQMA